MTKGYPTKSGVYWARCLEWNSVTFQNDIKEEKWIVAQVDVTCNPKYGVTFIGDENLYDIKDIYEYEEVEKPS